MTQVIRITEAAGLPKAVGPYSLATIAPDGTVYASGQVGLTPEGALVEGGIEAQTHQVMKNLGAILAAAGVDFSSVMRSDIFIASKEDFGIVNGVYESYFPSQEYPARQTVEAAPPLEGALVEISMIAYRP